MFKLNKKAMSAILVMILLLFLSVSSYFVLQDWFLEFSQNIESNYETQSKNSIYKNEILGLEGENLYFRNTLNKNISVLDIKIGNKSCGITNDLISGFNKINLSNCYENITRGVNEFVIITNQGVFTKTYYLGTSILGIPFIPSILGNSFTYLIHGISVIGFEYNLDSVLNNVIWDNNIEGIILDKNGNDFYSQGTYISKVFDAGVFVNWREINVNANVNNQVFLDILSGGNWDGVSDMVKTDDGYVVLGTTLSYGEVNGDILIMKFNFLGEEIWSKTIGGSNIDNSFSIDLCNDGGFIVSGHTRSFGEVNGDILVIKFNSLGEEIWSKTIGGGSYDTNYDVIQTYDNGFIISGVTTSFDGSDYDIILTKLDLNGNIVWNKLISTSQDDYGYSLIDNDDGNFFLLGTTNSFGGTDVDIFVSKFNSSGQVQWSKLIDGSNDDFVWRGIKSNNEGIVLIGSTKSFDGSSDYDFLIIKLNSLGEEIWSKVISGTLDDIFRSVIELDDNSLILTGSTKSFGGSDNDIFLSKFNEFGVEIWSKAIGGSLNDEGWGLTQIDNDIILSGRTSSYGGSDVDIFHAKITPEGNLGSFTDVLDLDISTIDPTFTFSDISLNVVDFTPTINSLDISEVNRDLYFSHQFYQNISSFDLLIRSCDDSNCQGENWETLSSNLIDKNNQYFQYMLNLTTLDLSKTPIIYNVTIDYVDPPIISNSLLFDGVDDYFTRTNTQAGDMRTWTWSGWIKQGSIKGIYPVFAEDGGSYDDTYITIQGGYGPSYELYLIHWIDINNYYIHRTGVELRDFSDWNHITIEVDTTNAVDTDRVKFYLNGKLMPSETYISGQAKGYIPQNTQLRVNKNGAINYLGSTSINFRDGYFAQVNFIDGQALGPEQFGEFNNYGKWIPKEYEGTYGTNGFKLDFENSSNLGQDFSGNSNNWNVYGSPIQTIDTPENNFAVLNPLQLVDAVSPSKLLLSKGNLKVNDGSASNYGFYYSTLALPLSGKYYWEYTLNTRYTMGGVLEKPLQGDYTVNFLDGATFYEDKIYAESQQTGLSIPQIGDIVSILYDADNKQVEFRVNNIQHGSIVNIANSQFPLFAVGGEWVSSQTTESVINFGQTPFTYTPPEGYKTLSSKNLEAPTVIPSQGFEVITYTGTGTERNIEGLDFSPYLVWIKNRDQADSHKLFDIVRGITKYIESNTANAQITDLNSLISFNSNGFTLGTGANGFNDLNEKFVSWNWKEGPEFGFDIVNYTGTGLTNHNIEHKLGVKPDLIIWKNLNDSQDWLVYHKDLTVNNYLLINLVDAQTIGTDVIENLNSTHMQLGVSAGANWGTKNWISYLFTSIEGFSKIGSYTGNGNVDGPFIYTGFKPKYVMIKNSDNTGFWVEYDSLRNQFNPVDNYLQANTNSVEGVLTSLDLVSNGFKIRADGTTQSLNTNGENYIYIAFAEYPLSTKE